ncbi:uncharacterized protein EV422DRAFT_544003 [Fimicolochytrium jonesii]|uniref:uncharacterized protein n=1 Tax=Fimicolochytrium jonesii TaxID=1396493 RepID=UPI0022FE747E|nr:uncharacterized protein EV422DRAFT_544003 [Fimicolochytrium jonesii]KAI8816792.1 hypothetical protein EV422DRAFT_544003 [Fimicolochytrium jonesii]
MYPIYGTALLASPGPALSNAAVASLVTTLSHSRRFSSPVLPHPLTAIATAMVTPIANTIAIAIAKIFQL